MHLQIIKVVNFMLCVCDGNPKQNKNLKTQSELKTWKY